MDELLGLLPPIKRARGSRLYAADGRRFLDLWLDGGRGLLGDRDRFARTFAANASDKGLTRPYPGLYDERFSRAVLAAFPGFSAVRLFENEERALAAVGRLSGAEACLAETAGPGAAGPAPGAVAVARPWLPVPEGFAFAMPRLPCPRPFSPVCLIARDGDAFSGERGDVVTALQLYAASRALASLESVMHDGAERNDGTYGEELWKRFDRRLSARFERIGPWLFARVPAADYPAFFASALEGGCLLSPRWRCPSVVPPDFDDGELSKLARALESR